MASQAGSIKEGLGTIYSGIEENRVAGVEAKQLVYNAGQTRAAGQSAAAIARRQGELVQSAQKAAAGASGAGVTDVSVQNLQAETGRTAEYNALSAIYSAESQARNMLNKADMTRFAGQQAQDAGFMKGVDQIAGAPSDGPGSPTLGEEGMSMFEKYAGQLPSWFGM